MIGERKSAHIEICAIESVGASCNSWDDVTLLHNAVPEINFDDIDTGVAFLGKRLKAPLVIAAMTGGSPESEKINENLAIAAAELGIGMVVGSQRPALEDREKARSYEVVKRYDVPLMIGNIGAPQLVHQKGKKPITLEDAKACAEMVGAHAIAIHLNFLQELTQPEGDLSAKGCLEGIRRIAGAMPVVAKETGAGLSGEVALELKRARVSALDVGGLGGTSFAAVEHYRSARINDALHARLGKTFWNWGIPTPVTLVQADVGLPMVATGGVRNGLDVARAIALGATCAGIARPLLRPAMESPAAVKAELESIIAELKGAMFLTSSPNAESLASKGCIMTGRAKEWLGQL
ncbi:MAG: type 2 isopentenyl-diphosphate Delta-isomerase [Methanobacteriota archaeon]